MVLNMGWKFLDASLWFGSRCRFIIVTVLVESQLDMERRTSITLNEKSYDNGRSSAFFNSHNLKGTKSFS